MRSFRVLMQDLTTALKGIMTASYFIGMVLFVCITVAMNTVSKDCTRVPRSNWGQDWDRWWRRIILRRLVGYFLGIWVRVSS